MLNFGMYLEHGSSLITINGEVVCTKCGRVYDDENVQRLFPFQREGEGADSPFEGHWQLGSSLCFLKGLGEPVLENNGIE